jgi:soluble lytic murein transglycosylase-like protein
LRLNRREGNERAEGATRSDCGSAEMSKSWVHGSCLSFKHLDREWRLDEFRITLYLVFQPHGNDALRIKHILLFGLLTAAAQAANAAESLDCPIISSDASSVRALIESEAKRQGVDVELALAISDQETRLGTHMKADKATDKGARGVMQLTPDTARRFAVNDVCDPADNVRGGVAYLKQLSGEFGGNILLVASAYNAGEGRVIDAKGVPPISETVRYAAAVANVYYHFDNALRGGARAATSAARDPSADPAGATPEAPTKSGQSWIGGSVLYVQGDE